MFYYAKNYAFHQNSHKTAVHILSHWAEKCSSKVRSNGSSRMDYSHWQMFVEWVSSFTFGARLVAHKPIKIRHFVGEWNVKNNCVSLRINLIQIENYFLFRQTFENLVSKSCWYILRRRFWLLVSMLGSWNHIVLSCLRQMGNFSLIVLPVENYLQRFSLKISFLTIF